jgi:hypothetical protein
MAERVVKCEDAMAEGKYATTYLQWKAQLPPWAQNESTVLGYILELWRDGHLHLVEKGVPDGNSGVQAQEEVAGKDRG